MSIPATLDRAISPPPLANRKACAKESGSNLSHEQRKCVEYPSLAAIEAGEAKIKDHLDYFSKHLTNYVRPNLEPERTVSISRFRNLYERNQHPNGHHFVVHQHNHPVAGTHYDLRLQFSETSSLSFAIPYGLPGNPNSQRPGRMAIETRVHNLWNHLIESASHATGSMLIWDTGEYSILPRKRKKQTRQTDEELSSTSDAALPSSFSNAKDRAENEKLISAFRDRYIRLRLHGAKLPPNYTITLRLPFSNNYGTPPAQPRRKRRRKASWTPNTATTTSSTTSEDENGSKAPQQDRGGILQSDEAANEAATAAASDVDNDNSDNEDEAATIHATNAYTGATNSIGSVHQRHWFVLLDKPSCGFVRATEGGDRGRWVRPSGKAPGGEEEGRGGFDPFFVLGAESERSVVTGRTSAEVMHDEGVMGFRPRRMWRPVLE